MTRVLENQAYLGVIEADEGAFVGRVAGLRDVVTFGGATFAEVEQALHDSADGYLTVCAKRRESPARPHSKKILLRVACELHRRVDDKAAGMYGMLIQSFD